MIIKLKFLVQDVDRHGNVRSYVRIKGRPKVRIRGDAGSAEFMAAYHAALSTEGNGSGKQKYKCPAEGSFGSICLAYYASTTFKRLDLSTQSWRRRALDRICEKHGDMPAVRLEAKHIRKLRDELGDHPAVANKRVKAIKALFRWAVEEAEIVDHDPARNVRAISYRVKGHHTWSVEEIGAFEQRHPIGTKPRLAMALMFFTACRLEDVVRLGPQHIHEGRVQYTQAKNEHRNPISIDIPMHSELAGIIDATPSGHLTFLVTAFGRPFTAKGFSIRFKDWCRQAGLPHCSSHGLRKAAATRLANALATGHEIMAITGHKSLKEVERYTQEAQKRRLADSGMSKFK